MLPQTPTIRDTFTIADLRKEDVAKQFNPCSTLYVPPLSFATHSSDVAVSLGVTPGRPFDRHTRFPPLRWNKSTSPEVPAYGPLEKAVISQLANHEVPSQHKVLVASPAMRKLVTELNASPALRVKLEADPKAFAGATEGLTDVEKFAVGTGSIGAMGAVMKALPGHEQSMDLLKSGDPVQSYATTVLVIIVI